MTSATDIWASASGSAGAAPVKRYRSAAFMAKQGEGGWVNAGGINRV